MKYDFCVVTQPRSGDEILISKLRSHPNVYITLGIPYKEFLLQTVHNSFSSYLLEYKYNNQNYDLKLNEQDIMHSLNTREYMSSYYDELIKIGCIDENEKEQITNFLDLIYTKDKEKKKEGYKLAAENALRRYRNYGITIYGEHFLQKYSDDILSDNPRYIILFRKNLLWQYVSTLLPIITNEHGYTKIIDTKLNIDPLLFAQFVSETLSERESIINTVSNTGNPHIIIYYEDLAKENKITLDTVQQFLNVPIQRTPLYGINPNNIYEETRPIETIIENYNDLREKFANDEEINSLFKMAETTVNPFYYEIRKAGTFKSLDFLREMYEGVPG